MSNNERQTSNQTQILDICTAFYQNEKFFNESYMKNKEYYGYLIDYNIIEEIRTKIKYENLKNFIAKDESYSIVKEKIKEPYPIIKEIIPMDIKQVKTELLNNDKLLYLIKQEYLDKISSNKNKIKGKEIKFVINNDNITIMFDQHFLLTYCNINCLIGKKFLWKQNNANNKSDKINFETPNGSKKTIKFNKDIEILIRIFYYNKYLKDNENDTFITLNQENKETIYLIHNSWMEQYKSHFNYQVLENYLKNKKEYNDSFIKNNNYFINSSNEAINNIIENLPPEYINEINNKLIFDDKKQNLFFEYTNYKESINYLINNHIINFTIFNALNGLNYKLNEQVKTFELYFIGKKNILLKSNDVGSNKDLDEIGTINDKGIFIPEYILIYKENNNISLDILNIFLKQDFFNFFFSKDKDNCEIKNGQNIVFGHCFRVKDNFNNVTLEIKNSIINGVPAQTQNNNTQIKQLNNAPENNQSNNESKKESNYCIELMINIYLFKIELKNKIKRNIKESSEEKKYIIKKSWMEHFKKIFDYNNKFVNYIKSKKIDDIIKKNNPSVNYNISEAINLFPEDYIKSINSKLLSDNIKFLKISKNYSTELKEKNCLFYYYNDIEIIDDKIAGLIKRLFSVGDQQKKNFLFGDNKIIMDLDIISQDSMIIGNFDNDYFWTYLLLHFYKKEYIRNYFKLFISNGYKNVMDNLIFNQKNEIFLKDNHSNVIGKYYKIFELEKNNNISTNIQQNEQNNIYTPKGNIDNNIDNNNKNKNNLNNQPTQIDNKKHFEQKQIKLSHFLESQIKTIITYYLFTENLKQHIYSSSLASECYLIDENWMNNFTKLMLYNEVIQQIKNILNIETDVRNVEKIYEKFEKKFLEKIQQNEGQIFEEINKINFSIAKENDVFVSGNINNIVNYNHSKFYIIDEETFKYMNINFDKKLNNLKKKDYLINEQKILIKISPQKIKKHEILICSLDLINYSIIPELLLKYENELLMANDFDYLKKFVYTKFKEERIFTNNNELINKNNKEKLGKIYNLKATNLLEQINNKGAINNNKNNEQPNKNNGQTEIKNEVKNIVSQPVIKVEQKIKDENVEEKIILSNPKNIQKFENNIMNNETRAVLYSRDNSQNILDENKIYHVEFLLRYICFEDKLNATINYYYKFNPVIENGYIINYELIKHFNEFYKSKDIKAFINHNDKFKCNYISENFVNDFINLTLQNLPQNYIDEIQQKSENELLLYLINKSPYKPATKYHLNQQFYYYENCVLFDDILGKYLIKITKDENINQFQKVKYMISNGKLILNQNLNLYFGNIKNDKSIYVPEIMICCHDSIELQKFIDEIKNNKINKDIILQNTKRYNNNYDTVGLYSNTNNIVIILKDQYKIAKKEERHPQGQQNGFNTNINNLQQQMKKLSFDEINQNMKGQNFQGGVNPNNFQGKNNINQFKPPTAINTEIKSEIKNILNVIIDTKIIRKKRKLPLNKDNNYEIYYPINREWFMKYMENYGISNIYSSKIIIQTLENIIENNSQFQFLANEEIIQNAKVQTEFMNIINNYTMKMNKGNYMYHISFCPLPIYIHDIFYYDKFILVSERTKNFLLTYNNYNNNNTKIIPFYCYFGENKIFVVFNGPQKYLIEVYYFDQFYNLFPEVFLKYYWKNELEINLSLLKEKGFYQYLNYFVLFGSNDKNNCDYASPIFDQNKKEIGYAYKYNSGIKDYSPYIINNEYKAMLKLYFSFIQMHSKSIMRKNENDFLLINAEYIQKIKDYYEFSALEDYLSKNILVQQTTKNIKEMEDYILTDKNITLIIKNLPNDFNVKFVNKSKYKVPTGNISEEPNKKYNQASLSYYDNFILINKELYNQIFKNNNAKIYGICHFINGYICIKMPEQLNKKRTYSCILTFGSLHRNNIFKAKYLLEYNTYNDFKKSFLFANGTGGYDNYINSFKFENNNIEQLTDIDGKNLGLIYNLHMAPPQPNPGPFPPVPVSVPGHMAPAHIPPPNPPKEPVKYPPLIGLKNVGATCYMNATLQCLSQIQNLVLYFKNNQHVVNRIYEYGQKNKACLSESFKYLIDNLWPEQYSTNHIKNNNNYYFAPNEFKNKISSMNPLFQGVQANDAKDLVNFIIMTLHEELNQMQKNPNVQNLNMNINQTNEQMMLSNFMTSFFGENKSIISDTFYGVHHTTTKCSNCPYIKHNFEAYFFLIFPLEEVRKFKIQFLTNRNMVISQTVQQMNPNMMMNMNMNQMNMNQINQNIMQLNQEFANNTNKINLLNSNMVDIYDCFDYNQKPEEFTGDNSMYCDFCKNTFPSTFTTTLYNGPDVLIVVLNRGQGIQFKVKLKFDFQLNLFSHLENKNSGVMYELIGVVTHMGESGAAGHFIATCKCPANGGWYQFNDDLVFPVSNFNEQLLNYAMPYILFFKKINNNMMMNNNNRM